MEGGECERKYVGEKESVCAVVGCICVWVLKCVSVCVCERETEREREIGVGRAAEESPQKLIKTKHSFQSLFQLWPLQTFIELLI